MQRLSVILFIESSIPCVGYKHNSGEPREANIFNRKRQTIDRETRYFMKVIRCVHTPAHFDLQKHSIFEMLNVGSFELTTTKVNTWTRLKQNQNVVH